VRLAALMKMIPRRALTALDVERMNFCVQMAVVHEHKATVRAGLPMAVLIAASTRVLHTLLFDAKAGSVLSLPVCVLLEPTLALLMRPLSVQMVRANRMVLFAAWCVLVLHKKSVVKTVHADQLERVQK